MGLPKALLLIAALATANAFNNFLPWDKEVIYQWKALVKAGTHLPAPYASQFELHGKIHFQANNNATHVQISDLTYKMYNGIMDHVHEHEAQAMPVPSEVSDLHNHVFKIIYDPQGLAIGIVTHDHEKEFSRNIKKAIATVFQLHQSVVTTPELPFGFIQKEQSIYGYSTSDYVVVPHSGYLQVDKMHSMKNSHHLYEHFYSNSAPISCDAAFEDPITHTSVKKYKIVEQAGKHIVQHIQSNGGIFYHPYQAKSDHQFVFVNQTFELVQTVPVQKQMTLESSGHHESHLTYHVFAEAETEEGLHTVEHIPDITNGRHTVKNEKMIPLIHTMLKGIWEYLQQDHINTQEPDTEQGQLLNRVQRLMATLKLVDLEQIHSSLSANVDVLNVYYHILPIVGSRASTLMIKKLVINKLVSDAVAEEILQHMPDNIMVPSTELVNEMEELIHLNDQHHWHVKKVAIMSFATLIHRSHKYYMKIHHEGEHENEQDTDHHHHHHHEVGITHESEKPGHEEPFMKYVMHYVEQVKKTSDVKVQMVYMSGLFNMGLKGVAQHLIPMIHGKDHNLRHLALWSVVPSLIAKGNESVFEVFWPILANHHEETNMRIFAYYFIMESKPSQTHLSNMHWLIMQDHDVELYRFHYTYVHSMKDSSNPCNEDFKLRTAQLHKYMHPPTHGLSHADLDDFVDIDFGFGGSVQSFHASTNESQVFAIQTTSQTFNFNHENYVIFVRISGGKFKDISRLTDLNHPAETPESVSITLIKRQHVMNTWYFNKDNYKDIVFLTDMFNKQQGSLTKNLWHLSYKAWKNVIPTDMGLPAVWEFLVPEVHKNDMSITKQVTNNVLNIHIDNRYVSWIHYRHGLSFYNPIADVWQGINRYHAYDSVLPLRWDVSFNPVQKSLHLSWKKHEDVKLDITGVKVHVKQMVFVKDDNEMNLLAKSSPNSKEFIDVTMGKKFRHDYTLLDHDDVNTGHHWHMEVFDSDHHVTNGSFTHLIHHLALPQSKRFDSPFSYLMMSFHNWNYHLLHLPEAGTHGFMLKAEPNRVQEVTNVDMSIRINTENVKGDNIYTPSMKWTTRLTYAVKNKEQSIKTWDVNVILDLNNGHTVNNLKMVLTRIIPGQKDYKVCVDGTKKWSLKGVSGHLNLAMSQSGDGKCSKDDTLVDINMMGEPSQEQIDKTHPYGACQYVIPYSVPHYHTLQCLVAHTTVRKYVYNVKSQNVPTQFRHMVNDWWEYIKGYHMYNYHHEDEHTEDIAEHNLKVDVMYPMQGHEVDVHITAPQHYHSLTGINTEYLQLLGMYPDSTVYPIALWHLHEFSMLDHCDIHHDHIHFNAHEHGQEVPKDWTMYVGSEVEEPKFTVQIKHVSDDLIAVKIVEGTNTMELVPVNSHMYQMTVDGQVATETSHQGEWVSWHQFSQDVHHPVAIMLVKSGAHFEFDGHHLMVVVPIVADDHKWSGRCFEHQH